MSHRSFHPHPHHWLHLAARDRPGGDVTDCVLVQMSWFLLARSLDDMKRWMAAINLRTRHIFQREHGVFDDYRGQG